MGKRSFRRGFTLVELLVVIAIIEILVALLLPAIQAAREAARRTQCLNNLKNISLALQNYHDTYKVFPQAATNLRGAGPSNRMGPSWWYGIFPFIEQRNMLDKLAATHRSGAVRPHFRWEGGEGINQFPADAGCAQVALAVEKFAPEFMRCPSSPLPVMHTQTGPVCLPSYVAIAGGTDIDPASPHYAHANPNFGLPAAGTRVFTNPNVESTGSDGGIVTSSGMLLPKEHTNIAKCTDGTSNTMIVSEQSDWLRNVNATNSTKYHGDPGWWQNTSRGGWLTGLGFGRTRVVQPRTANVVWDENYWNFTTVRYRADRSEDGDRHQRDPRAGLQGDRLQRRRDESSPAVTPSGRHSRRDGRRLGTIRLRHDRTGGVAPLGHPHGRPDGQTAVGSFTACRDVAANLSTARRSPLPGDSAPWSCTEKG